MVLTWQARLATLVRDTAVTTTGQPLRTLVLTCAAPPVLQLH